MDFVEFKTSLTPNKPGVEYLYWKVLKSGERNESDKYWYIKSTNMARKIKRDCFHVKNERLFILNLVGTRIVKHENNQI
jgi:hypothetical protein